MLSTSSLAPPTTPTWLDVDLAAIAANVRALRQLIGPRTALGAVVKADAYGLGAETVARVALVAGATVLAVARVEEGIALRRAGIEATIPRSWIGHPRRLGSWKSIQLKSGVYPVHQITFDTTRTRPPSIVG